MGEGREKPQDWKIRQYYEQEELKQKVVEVSEYREVAPTYPNGYGKRPDSINFPGDFEQLIENGAVALHASVEKWKNPLLIDNVNSLDDLRTTWDLVIDIDCDYSFELAKETAVLVVNELRQHGIETFGVKFSGNRGFHIGVNESAFPEKVNDKDLAQMYPRLPRGIIEYLRSNLEDEMINKVREYGFEEEMEDEDGLNPYLVSDIENNWGQRHLFRMPYSLHDGSWLVSLPIEPERIMEFEKEEAEIDKVKFDKEFMPETDENEATNLVVQAMDYLQEQRDEKEEEMKERKNREFDRPDDAIPEEFFPPTINNILEGLEDGRKRGLFVLINFFRTLGYSWNEIESKIWEWNEKNEQELRESYVKSQINWHKNRDEDVPPPNYDAKGYYKDMQVYEGDNLEEKVPNPVSYAFKKANFEQDGDEEDDGSVECPVCGKEYQSENSYYKKHVQQCFE